MDDAIWQSVERSSAVDYARRIPRGAAERSFAAQLDHAMRSKRFLSQSLSAAAGISAASVRNYLRGRFLPRHNIVAALEEILQVRFDLHDPSVTEARPVSAENGPTLPSDKLAPL